MTLRELLDRVVEVDVPGWHRVPGFPAPGAVAFDLSSRPRDEAAITNVRTHYAAAVLIENPEVSIAWGMELQRDLHFDFTDRMPDRSVSSSSADIMLNGSVVHRMTYLDVDGGRAMLPMPKAMVNSLDLTDIEPPRDSWRLQPLRGWSHVWSGQGREVSR